MPCALEAEFTLQGMEQVWASRLRWRLRGAVQWPLFAVLLVVDAVLLHELPIAGEGPDWMLAVLEAGFFNLAIVAIAAPLAGRLVRRRRPDMPALIAGDYAGAVLLVIGSLALAGAGLAHRAQVRADRAAFAAGVVRVRAYVAHSAPAQYRRRLAAMTTLRFGEDLFRACVPGDDPRRWLCLYVFTDQDPPGLRRDSNRAPNSSFFPPDRGG